MERNDSAVDDGKSFEELVKSKMKNNSSGQLICNDFPVVEFRRFKENAKSFNGCYWMYIKHLMDHYELMEDYRKVVNAKIERVELGKGV